MSLWQRISRQAWLKQNQFRFLRLPVARRVSLAIGKDGRFNTYLLTALYEAGYGVQVADSPALSRELLDLAPASPLPFVMGGKPVPCGWSIRDTPQDASPEESTRTILLDYDFFRADDSIPRMPYFMHPTVYHQGLHRRVPDSLASRRCIRLGFFGSHDADFYQRSFRFQMLNRTQILDFLLAEFGAKIISLEGDPQRWPDCAMAVSIDRRGGDHERKAFLPLPVYWQALQSVDFFLSPPGWIMPFSHNLIEGMANGSIPLLNYPQLLTPPLRDGIDCLTFSSLEDLRGKIAQILAMSPETISRMRQAVRAYYETHLAPGAWMKRTLGQLTGHSSLLVNNEEKSVPLTPFVAS